jgi:hypothetical protein
MTLSELDEAFNDGLVDGNCHVCKEGDQAWATLRDVAGLDDEPEPPPESQALSLRPAAIALSSAGQITGELTGDIDIDEDAFRPKPRSRAWTFLAVAGVIGGVAFAGHQAGWRLASAKSVSTPFSKTFAAPRPPRTFELNSARVVEVPPPSAPTLDCKTCPQNMTEAQKKAAAEAEQKRALKKAHAAPAPVKRKTKVFQEGGDRLDPLNSKI